MAVVSAIHSGWKKVVGNSIIGLAVYSAGQKRLEIGNVALTTEGGTPTSAILFGAGNSTTRVDTATASSRFLNFYLQYSGTTGFSQGLQINMTHTSTATESEAIRAFLTNTGTVTSGSLHGFWSTISMGTGGTNSGLTAAGRFTCTAAASVGLTGTPVCLQLDMTIAATNTLTGNEGFIRFENVGATKITGYVLDGVNLDTVAMFQTASDTTITKKLKCRLNGTQYWLCFTNAV